MAKPKLEIATDRLALYDRLVEAHPEIERRGASMPYTSVNGHMFSFLSPTGSMALRLPDGAREKFLAKYGTKLFEQHGTVLKEYVTVPDSLLGKTKELGKHLEASLAYVRTLKPKPTQKKTAKAAKKK